MPRLRFKGLSDLGFRGSVQLFRSSDSGPKLETEVQHVKGRRFSRFWMLVANG